MTDENVKIVNFLKTNGLEEYERIPLAGDASFRRYERILGENSSYMLMVAPPEVEDVKPFIKVDNILRDAGLKAPEIIAQDIDVGLLLLEDFGDDSYSNVLRNGANEHELYSSAIEVLEALPKDADVPIYSKEKLTEELCLFTDWFAADSDKDKYLDIWDSLLKKLDWDDKVLVLRDYHADNLMWLTEPDGSNTVGLLDFQDALIGHPAYDYVSLLQDARRDVGNDTVEKILADKSEEFISNYQILGAQRNLKIIGIFNRLKKRDGKDNYLKLLPRVWQHLSTNIQHPDLAELKSWLEEGFDNELAA